jgi:hypothetical protein
MPLKRSPPDEPLRPPVDRGRGGGVVEVGIEHRDVVELGVPGRPVDVAQAAFDGQVALHLPGVLQEGVHRERAPLRARLGSDLAVVREQAERGIGDRVPRASRARVRELESPVLVVGVAGLGAHVDLVHVVFAGVLHEDAGLKGVAATHVGEVVGEGVDRSGGIGRIGPPSISEMPPTVMVGILSGMSLLGEDVG